VSDRKMHSHTIEEIHWSSRPLHAHNYRTRTTLNNGHTHLVGGTTSPSSGGIDHHVHSYEGVTSFDDGHVHRFRGVTGPAIPLPSGGHTHEFSGRTTFDNGHVHYYRGRTGRGI
jgi:hypothetical protein